MSKTWRLLPRAVEDDRNPNLFPGIDLENHGAITILKITLAFTFTQEFVRYCGANLNIFVRTVVDDEQLNALFDLSDLPAHLGRDDWRMGIGSFAAIGNFKLRRWVTTTSSLPMSHFR